MNTELLTNWGEYQAAIDRLLPLAERELLIFDADLVQTSFETPARYAELLRLVQHPDCRLRLALQSADHLRQRSPRLLELLRHHAHRMEVVEIPENLASLRDCMILADRRHGLIRFDHHQARSKLILDDEIKVAPYRQRFEAIWQEGGSPISATSTGL